MEDSALRDSVLRVEPEHELCFRGPFTNVVTSHLKLTNTSDKKVCFKVKTTAPRRYCVRPNNGILAPKASVNVILRLQPLDTPDTENTKHKFMVQSLIAPPDNFSNLDKVWRDATPNQVMSSKLRCVFENANGDRISTEDINRITVANAASYQSVFRRLSSTSTASTTSTRSTEQFRYFMPTNTDSRNGIVEDDVRLLRLEVEKLRHENRAMRDNEIRLRKVTGKSGAAGHSRGHELSTTNTPKPYPSFVYILVALILGLVFGKFIL